MKISLSHRPLTALVLLLAIVTLATAADEPGSSAVLQPSGQRKPAPAIELEDSLGKTATLVQYRGRVVVLDFWATWCHGCKQEIPWFAEFHQKYASKGLVVIGVSLDEDGWKVVKPFIETAKVPYRIVLGSNATATLYGIRSMPDTFLIDRQGRLAATYNGMVDRDNIDKNIQAMLAER
ncbi:MAG TPA: TlpA disulfide reductase family protein [Candidatus Acidoferrales bacterium]|jgi:peroxiredoxin|nr:TlpA disulfide reductase family protein [Candidatus Acidoferrales bacterium]